MYFTPFSSVFIVNFEQVNAGLAMSFFCYVYSETSETCHTSK